MQVYSGFAPTRVGLISTEPIRLAGLESAFENHPSIVAVAGGLDAMLADRSLRYLILDLSFNSAWMEMQIRVRRARPDLQQIVLGPGGGEELPLRSIAGGARAYLGPDSGPLAVRQAAETVIRGSIWAPRSVLSKLIDRLLSQSAANVSDLSPVYSPRERQVLDLIMTACSNREIAVELGIEERTVKAYVTSLMRKTGAENRVSLSVLATQDSMRHRRPLPA